MPYLILSLPSPPSPIMFKLGPLQLHYYGLFIALGIAAGTWLAGRELERKGYDGALALDSLFFTLIPAFIGARLYHVITDYELYRGHPFPGVFEIWNGGLGIYGGVIGGFLGVLLFSRVRGISPLVFADAAAPGLVLGQAVGRWGNYFNQELFGLPSKLPWAIRIAPENRPAGYANVTSFQPTFLYESIWDIIVALALLWIARRFASRLRAGDIALLYVSLYSLGRFFVESLRIDTTGFMVGPIRGNLFVESILVLGAALFLLLRHSRNKPKRPQAGP
ncbi:MAG: prolipoprotein diacylglyceryl transferase [Rubrobacteraceae bacterium]